MMTILWALLLLIVSNSGDSTPAVPVAHGSTGEEKNATIVTSGRLDFDNIKHTAVFSDNVHVRDSEGDMWADKMVVHFDPKSRKLKKLISTGKKVIIVTEGKRSLSRMAVYTAQDGKIVLTGNPRITQGRNTYGAEKIIIFKGSERTIFEPKARLILYSEEGSETAEGIP
jgi:lipopolysaccharide export system protein LptA